METKISLTYNQIEQKSLGHKDERDLGEYDTDKEQGRGIQRNILNEFV